MSTLVWTAVPNLRLFEVAGEPSPKAGAVPREVGLAVAKYKPNRVLFYRNIV